MRRSVVASGDERNEERGTWDYRWRTRDEEVAPLIRVAYYRYLGRTRNEEAQGTRKYVGRGKTWNEEVRGTSEYEGRGNTWDVGLRGARKLEPPLARAGSVPRS